MNKMECPFCNLDMEKTRILDETQKTRTIISNPALVKLPLLVIPKKHVEKPSELDKQEREEIFNQIIKFQELLLKKFSGCDIKQHFKPFLKQDDYKINHLHFHIIPREFEDEIYKKCQINEKQVFKFLNQEELEEIKNKLLS